MPIKSVNIIAQNKNASAPILWRLGRLYHVVTNVTNARVSDEIAFVKADIEGSSSQIASAVAYLQSLGLLSKTQEDATLPASVPADPESSVSKANNITVRLNTVTSSQSDIPLLYRIGRDYEIVVNILEAEYSHETGGYLVINLSGPLGEIQRAIAYLHTTGVHIDARQRSVTDFSNL